MLRLGALLAVLTALSALAVSRLPRPDRRDRLGAGGGGAAVRPQLTTDEFYPSDGYGLDSVTFDGFCAEFAASVTGSLGWCHEEDGTHTGLAFVLTLGTPTSTTATICGSGETGCESKSVLEFDDAEEYQTADVANPAANFSWCGFGRLMDSDSNGSMLGKAGANGCYANLQAGGGITAHFFGTSVNSTAGNQVFPGQWRFVCGTYERLTAGTSVGKLYVDGALLTTNSTLGLWPAATTYMAMGTDPMQEGVAFTTETLLDAATIALMSKYLWGAHTTAAGQALTYTRAGSRGCQNAAGTHLTIVPPNIPCFNENGYLEEGGTITNRVWWGMALAHGIWTAASGGGAVAPVVTDNTNDARDIMGGYNFEKVVFAATTGGATDVSALTQSVTVTAAAKTAAGVYGIAASGTSCSVYLYAFDGTTYFRQLCAFDDSWATGADNRCALENFTPAATPITFGLGVNRNDASQSGQAACTLIAGGVEVQVGGGGLLSSYIPSTVNLSRGADALTFTNTSGWPVATGSTSVKFTPAWGTAIQGMAAATPAYLFDTLQASNLDGFALSVDDSDANATCRLGGSASGGTVAWAGYTAQVVAGTSDVISCAYVAGSETITTDTVLRTTEVPPANTIPRSAGTTVYIGDNRDGNRPAWGWIKELCFDDTTTGCAR